MKVQLINKWLGGILLLTFLCPTGYAERIRVASCPEIRTEIFFTFNAVNDVIDVEVRYRSTPNEGGRQHREFSDLITGTLARTTERNEETFLTLANTSLLRFGVDGATHQAENVRIAINAPERHLRIYLDLPSAGERAVTIPAFRCDFFYDFRSGRSIRRADNGTN